MNITFDDLLQYTTSSLSKKTAGTDADVISVDNQSMINQEKKDQTQENEELDKKNQQSTNSLSDFFQFSPSVSQNTIPSFDQENFFDQKNSLQTDIQKQTLMQDISENTKEQEQIPTNTINTNDDTNNEHFTSQSVNFQESSNTTYQVVKDIQQLEDEKQEKNSVPSEKILGDMQQPNIQQHSNSQQSFETTTSITTPDFKPMHIVLDDLIPTKNQEQKPLGENIANTPTFDIGNNSFDFNNISTFDSEKNLQTSNTSLVSVDVGNKKNLLGKTKKTKVWLAIGAAIVSVCCGFFYLFVTRPLLFDNTSTYRGNDKLSKESSLQTPLADSIEKNTTGDTILSLFTGEEQSSEKENITNTNNMQTSPTETLSTENISGNISNEVLASDVVSSLETGQMQDFSSGGIVGDILLRLEKMEQDTIKIITHAQTIQEKKIFIKGQLLLRSIAKFKNDIQSTSDIDTGFVAKSLDTIQVTIQDMQQQLGTSFGQSSESFSQNLPSDEEEGTQTQFTGNVRF